ncbi:putative bicyclomycin resistance protein [Colletotrichum godetiae]|uniref:Bicyclomycin resistance protein n=1 Tax=Colletotrichum godetiae TaxID=1209918 RepID=A0AAJ0AYX7_9PEZI|nr:putative bicyclomycin resistance protein [Colletotrichum godetiae]KAK1700868.1 putative bicyclomycin resistance protein [Colletotrichum godetiae]
MQGEDEARATTIANIVQSSDEAKPAENRQEANGWEWEDDSSNPYNWPQWKKNLQLAMISIVGFSCSVGTSIVSPARSQFVKEFGVSSTAAFLPLSLYVLALGLGPVLGGPLSETAGRQAVHVIAVVFGGLFALGSGLTHSFSGLCAMRFLSGFFYGPVLAVGSGVLNETYLPVERGLPSTIFILSPFLGPGLGKGWRWTQYTLVFFSAFSLIWLFLSGESYHPTLLRRRRKQLGLVEPRSTTTLQKSWQFLTVGLLRPLHMLFTEPIVAILSLYVACMFGTLFMFFGAFFYVFDKTHGYTLTQTGLVFLAIAFGCVLGCITMVLCDHHLYQPRARRFSPGEIPPELRLYPAMLGSLGLPVSLFWFGWTARPDVNAAAPIIAIVIFGWGNITLTISSIQYLGDTYHRSNVASAASANSLARYTFAAAFPFFSLQMYQKLGIGWASSLLGFLSLILLPGPWIFFKYGKVIRQRSQYETASY